MFVKLFFVMTTLLMSVYMFHKQISLVGLVDSDISTKLTTLCANVYTYKKNFSVLCGAFTIDPAGFWRRSQVHSGVPPC